MDDFDLMLRQKLGIVSSGPLARGIVTWCYLKELACISNNENNRPNKSKILRKAEKLSQNLTSNWYLILRM